jgi:hypothetical protein
MVADAIAVALSMEGAKSVLRQGPKQLALALPELKLEAALVALRSMREGTGVVALEPRMALEV